MREAILLMPNYDIHSGVIDRIFAGQAIVVLCAPPGFGKGQLAREAVKRISRAQGLEVRQFGHIEHHVDPRAAADFILSVPTSVALIEDVSLADRLALRRALERVALGTHGQRIILQAGQSSEVELARLLAERKVDVLDAQSLRLRSKDIAASLKAIANPSLRSRIGEIVGDWPIALELLCAWAAATHDYGENWEDVDIVRESRLGEFIDQEVVPLFGAEELAALCRACLLDRPELEILSTTSENGNDARILANLAFRFKGLIDRHADEFVVQPALRIWLREGVQVLDPDNRLAVLSAMADRCSQSGRLTEAAILAKRAGNASKIREYAHAHGALRIWIVHGFSVLKALLDNSGPDDVVGSVVLRMIQCIVHLKAGRIRDAQDLFEGLSAEVPADHVLARDLEIVRVTLLAYGCSLEQAGDLELLRRLVAGEADDSAMRTFLATLSVMLNCQRARFDTAVSSLIDARSHAKRAQSDYNLLFLPMHEASINLAQGKLKDAKTCLADAARRRKHYFPNDIGAETVIAALSASIEFEGGQLTRARNSLRKSAHRMPEAEAWFDIYFAAYEPMIRVTAIDHGIQPMTEFVENEAQLLRAQGLPRVADLIKAICLCVCGEARLQGQALLPELDWTVPMISATSSWQEHEVFSIATAYRLHFDQQHEHAAKLLDEAIAHSERRGLDRSRLRYLLVAFNFAIGNGDEDRATSLLRAAIAIGTASGMRRIFREIGGVRLTPRLSFLREDPGLTDLERSFVDTLVNGLRDRQSVASGKLSGREIEVLRALSGGGSDKQLARQLDLSEHGVRFHLKSIFKKLGVHDRLSAVAAARQMETSS